MPRDRRKVEKALKKKGFKKRDGAHKYFVYYTRDGLKSDVQTMTSRTPRMKVIPDNIIAEMARQLHLGKSGFLQLVDCTMSRATYEQILVDTEIV